MTSKFLDSIKNASSWDDIYTEFKKNNVEKDRSAGKLFEHFCRHYYLSEPSVKNEYKHVWLFHEIPSAIKQKLNLSKVDHGIDLVLQGRDGTLSVVQCKFRNNQDSIISWSKDNLANLFADGDKADYFIVFTNASGLDKHSLTKQSNKLKIITLGDLLNISSATFDEMRTRLSGSSKVSTGIKKPRPYQQKAIQTVVEGFKQSDRGQLILPCGAGKTLISLWVKEALKAKHTLVLVPSLALLRQVKNEWAINSSRFVSNICVCSEKDIDKGGDLAEVHTYEIGGKVSTDPKEIRKFLNENKNKETIVYSTYQSLDAICKATKKIGFKFELAICDEAHKTAGSKKSPFGFIHFNKNIAIKKRLYMTATPRVVGEHLKSKLDEEQISYLCDMGEPKTFGPEFFRMSFKEAIDKKILVDYKIVAVGVSEEELEKAIKQRAFVSDNATIDEIANNYALEKFMEEYHPTHAITFHSSVKKAKSFQERHKENYSKVDTYHVNGGLTTNLRNVLMKEFEHASKSVMTNARCLTEGIDMPAIDVVYFCDPKNSLIDIVQASGRALRRKKGKELGYIVVPIFHRKQEAVEIDIDAGPFKNLMTVVRALSSQDERLVDEINAVKLGLGKRKASSEHISINSSCDLITLIGFHEKLKASLFYQVISHARFSKRKFEEARDFVRSLGLKGVAHWQKYCKSGKKPSDIPAHSDRAYKSEGWKSWGDWLGTGTIAHKDMGFRPFPLAREFVYSLGLKNVSDWNKYSRSGNRPNDIPSNPGQYYKNEGWKSWGDWLGTGTIAHKDMNFRLFPEARDFVHTLGIKDQKDWQKYVRSGKKPVDIPSNPASFYKNNRWKSWGDWLGTGKIGNSQVVFWKFQQAREFVHSLGLKNKLAWERYCKSGERPSYIPSNPNQVYEDDWKSVGDWLGTGSVATFNIKYRWFKDAREFVWSLGLKSQTEWKKYCKSGKKPNDIPSNPNITYKNDGWKSMGDWLGTGTVAPRDMVFRLFEDARKFVHSLGLKNQAEWYKYCKNGKKPTDIPSYPPRTYKDSGWISWPDWLGTDRNKKD